MLQSTFSACLIHMVSTEADSTVWDNIANLTTGESIPMNTEGKLKFNFEVSYTNLVHHEASGQTISVPPVRTSQSTWSHDVPEQLKQNLKTVVEHVYGKNAPGLSIQSYRMCWYEYSHLSVLNISLMYLQGCSYTQSGLHHQPPPCVQRPIRCSWRLIP
jgi:hypothetical protein